MATSEYIGVPIHKDVTDYEEKIYGGVTGRQVACFALSALLAVTVGWVCTHLLLLPISIASYAVILVAAPPVVFSMVKPDGLAPETYAQLVLSQLLNPQRLGYRVETNPLTKSFHGMRDKTTE